MKYLLVILNDGRSFRLQVEADLPNWLIGIEVKADGEEVKPRAKADIRKHVIDRSAIRATVPLTMNLHYGELEPVQ